MNLLKWFCANVLNLLGAFFIGLSIPTNYGIIIKNNPMLDFIIIMPIGIILTSISFYYKFVNTSWK